MSNTYEFFVERPQKVIIQASSEEEAVQILKQQLKLSEIDNVKITRPIETETVESS